MKQPYLIVFWSPCKRHLPDFYPNLLSGFLNTRKEITLIDCKNHRDKRTIQILRQADLVVVVLRQNEKFLDSYFTFRDVPISNPIYLICDYFANDRVNLSFIIHRYRIDPDRLCAVPYNIHLKEADRKGRPHCYMQSDCLNLAYETCIEFSHMLAGCASAILKAVDNFYGC